MAKKRSKKQLANDKRLGKMAKTKKVNKSYAKKIKVSKVAKRKTYKKKSIKSTASGMLGNLAPLIAPIAYGFVRERASDMLNSLPFMQKIPASQFTDEGIMLASLWALKKTGIAKKGIAASLVRAGKTIELARIGETFADMQAKKNNQDAGMSTAW